MDNDAILDLITQVAERIITPRFRALAEGEVIEKRPGDLVTVADREAEAALTEALAAVYPEALILGEEATEADPALLQRFVHAEHAFTIDPIDGTHNFVHGSVDHAVMIAELRDGVTVRSFIWQPEHRLAFVAELGAGATCNGVTLERLVPDDDPAQWRGISSQRAVRAAATALAPVQETWFCAGVDYSQLARGAVDFIVFNHAKPWDHAPGSLLISELGGLTVRADGSRYRPTDARPWLVAGASPRVAEEAREVIAPVFA